MSCVLYYKLILMPVPNSSADDWRLWRAYRCRMDICCHSRTPICQWCCGRVETEERELAHLYQYYWLIYNGSYRDFHWSSSCSQPIHVLFPSTVSVNCVHTLYRALLIHCAVMLTQGIVVQKEDHRVIRKLHSRLLMNHLIWWLFSFM